MRFRNCISSAIFLIMLATPAAHAQSGRADYDMCRAASNALDRIRLCTTALQTTSDRQLRERLLLRRGNSFQELERSHEAIQDYSDLIRLNPRVAGYYDNRKSALQSLGRYAEALEDANAAIARAPGYAFVYRSRGSLFEDMQRFEAAILDLDRALSINPSDYGMVIDRGRMKVRAGRAAEAVGDLSQVILLDPTNNYAYRERGFAYLALGDRSAAASDLALFARAVPGDEIVVRALADLASGARSR